MAAYLRDERKRARARARRRRAITESHQSVADAFEPIPVGPERQRQALDRPRGGGPDMMLRLQRGHGNAYCNRLVDQPRMLPAGRLISRATGAEMVGASSTAMSFKDPRKGHGPIKAGESNYSRMLLGETGEKVEDPAALASIKDSMLRAVPFDGSGYEPQIKALAARKEMYKQKRDDFNSHQYLYGEWNGLMELNDARGKAVEQNRTDLQQRVEGYNPWTQRANGFFMSVGRLDAMCGMLGIPGGNYDNLSANVTKGLAEAKEVGEAASMDKATAHGADIPVPPANTSVFDATARSGSTVRELSNAYIGYQQNILKMRKAKIDKEGDDARAEQARIDDVKAFVKQVGGTVDSAMSFVAGAPAAVENATAFVHKGEAQINAYRNKKALMRGEDAPHATSLITADEKGNTIVRDVQTGMDWNPDAKPGEQYSPSPSGGGGLPLTPGAALEKIVDFVYAADVKRITTILDQIETRTGNVQASIDMNDLRKNVQTFRAALLKFAESMTELQHNLEQRRNDYLKFGLKLDEFVQKNSEMRKQGKGLGQNQERYATIMVVASQIREVMAVGDGAAQDAAANKADVRNFWQKSRDERHDMSMSLTEGEVTAHQGMYDGTEKFQNALKSLHKLFNPVEAGAKDLFSSKIIAPGGNAGGSY
jgi:hypothetical protein